MNASYYHFVSSLRQGLASSISQLPADDKQRAAISVDLHLQRRTIGATDWVPDVPPINKSVQLFGPGDLEAFDSSMIVRTDPKPDSGNFEPNMFPAVEFADPDFIWRFSPEPIAPGGSSLPETATTLTPWITLVVLVAEDRGENIKREYVELKRSRNQRPAIQVLHQSDLPNLSYAWRWAHVQATTGDESLIADRLSQLTEEERLALSPEDIEVMNAAEMEALYASHPELVVSRLLCPRRLMPKTLYHAFVVPTYKLGWATALGTAVSKAAVNSSRAYDLAWDNTSNDPIDLPYFYDFEFRTSERGDFEYLVRLLEGRKLVGLGTREMDCEHPGFGLTVEVEQEAGEITHRLGLEGALQSINTSYTSWGRDRDVTSPEEFQVRLAEDVLSKANVEARITLPDDLNTLSVTDVQFNVTADGNGLEVNWRTNAQASGLVSFEQKVGQSWSGNIQTEPADSDDSAMRHSAILSNLIPEATYRFKLTITRDGTTNTTDEYGTFVVPLPAVVPPVYGKWHRARSSVESSYENNEWLDVLNLDPRHRAASGSGSEVVRKQQDGLMASAWEQLGDIETANDILRRAQLGRESLNFMHKRFEGMSLDNFMSVSAPLQKRVVRTDEFGERSTIQKTFEKTSRIPDAALYSSFRRISRPRGPLKKRSPQRVDLIQRLASGSIAAAGSRPKLPGTIEPGDISRKLRDKMIEQLLPSCDFSVVDLNVNTATKIFNLELDWVVSGATSRIATGPSNWIGHKLDRGNATIGPVNYMLASPGWSGGNVNGGGGPGETEWIPLGPSEFKLTCTGNFGITETKIVIYIDEEGDYDWTVETEIIDITKNDSQITFGKVQPTENLLSDRLPETPAELRDSSAEIIAASGEILGKLQAEAPKELPPIRSASYLAEIRSELHEQLKPGKTIVERTRNRLKINFASNNQNSENTNYDPLDVIMAYPVFPQPMYEPLRDISQSMILQGVEKVPQNTVGLLETNGRFLESYMVGLNHEFSGELLWRKFPTDQRGSCFRQFWDVSEYVPKPDEVDDQGELLDETKEKLKDIKEIHRWWQNALGDNDNRASEGKGESLVLIVRGDLLKRYPNALIYAVDGRFVSEDNDTLLYPKLAEYGYVFEIANVDTGNDTITVSSLIDSELSVGGQIQIVDSTNNNGIYTIKEKLSSTQFSTREPIIDVTSDGSVIPLDAIQYPIFRGSLGADLSFMGFPFDETIARSREDDNYPGIFFVLEERLSEARFGLDITDETSPEVNSITIEDKYQLAWNHFSLTEESAFGKYLDLGGLKDENGNFITTEDPFTIDFSESGKNWNESTASALRAQITLQRPARLIIHADQILPDSE